jgi:hypothetical protein
LPVARVGPDRLRLSDVGPYRVADHRRDLRRELHPLLRCDRGEALARRQRDRIHDPCRDAPYGRRDSLPGRRIRADLYPGRLRCLRKWSGFTGDIGFGDLASHRVGYHSPGPL